MSYHPPHPKAPGLSVGIDEAMVAELVNRFYAEVRQDELLGPIFNSRIEDWDEHLAKLCAFWSSVVLMSGRYKGQPMPAHIAIAEISDEHFMRWLELFAETANVVCPPEAAALFVDRSQRIAQSLRLGIAASKGIIA
ncbi:MAG: group III truncated hemoglobin [Hyphomicrobium sp.]|uniref:group III truncated hemoglobin n=1 Tax=Hyphomicrobium sp. TaxID=82 RepID=UPI003565579A